jgi:hypothetical protein
MGVLSIIAGMVVIGLPISSIVVLAIVAGVWLVVIGTAQIVWAVKARKVAAKVEQFVGPLKPSAAPDHAAAVIRLAEVAVSRLIHADQCR